MLFTLLQRLTTLSLDDLQVAVSQAEERRKRGKKRKEGGEGTGHKKRGNDMKHAQHAGGQSGLKMYLNHFNQYFDIHIK